MVNQKGNRNSMRHGLRSARLPAGCQQLGRQVAEFRRSLESAVVDARGSVSARDASIISAAVKWEIYSSLSARWLRLHDDTLAPAEKLRFAGESARASSSRDGCVRKLRLPEQGGNLWANFDGDDENENLRGDDATEEIDWNKIG